MLNFKSFLNRSPKYTDVSKLDYDQQAAHRKQYHELTNKNVSDKDVEPISKYLANSKPFDDHYKGDKTNPEIREKAKRIEGVIKKTKTPHGLILHRGFQSEQDIKPGTEITHHSITSYGGDDSFAKRFHDDTRKNHIIRLKVPAGTHAAYIEHINQQRVKNFSPKQMSQMYNHGGEENWVLHPNSRVRITKSSHDAKSNTTIHDAELVHDGVKDTE